MKGKLQTLTITVVLIVAIIALGGCRRQDTTTDQRAVPTAAGESSPLPTPGLTDSPVAGGNSPLPTPGAADSPVTQ